MIWDLLFSEGPRSGHALSVHDGTQWRRQLWSEVVAQAESYADGLRRAGVQRGDVVGTILTNSSDAVAGLLGIWLSGGVVASLPVPARGMELPQYVAQIVELTRAFDVPYVISDGAIAGALNSVGEHVRLAALGWSDVRGAGRLADTPPTGEEIAFIQYSSGSTSTPKGCMLSARAIGAQVNLIIEMLDAATHADEVVASWLPLSHDMGLFGCLLPPCAHGADLFLSSPERFIKAPRSWLRDCMDASATITAGPNSALRLAARAARSSAFASQQLRLKRIIVGAEPIQKETLDQMLATYGPAGLRPDAFVCAYGLAEATLAVTAIQPHEEPSAISVDGASLADGIVKLIEPETPGAAHLVSVGRPCPGVSISLDPGLPGRLSEIRIRSTSLASGYYDDPERTASRFVNDEFLTGDLGFLLDDQLYVVGRLDDMISINGRNVYAAEVELAMASLDSIRRGCCTIVDVAEAGRTKLVALAELSDDAVNLDALASTMSSLAARTAGVRLDECVFLTKGGLPKTPSGKTQRYRSRALATASAPCVLARIPLA
jgi:acyl-CoA synthetase (AMP-forming)/AMP-acid ligase II